MWTALSFGMFIFDVPVANKYRSTNFLETDNKRVSPAWHIWGWKISGKLAFGTYIKDREFGNSISAAQSQSDRGKGQKWSSRDWPDAEVSQEVWGRQPGLQTKPEMQGGRSSSLPPHCALPPLSFWPVLSSLTVSCGRTETLGHLYKVAESPLPFLNKQMKSIFV